MDRQGCFLNRRRTIDTSAPTTVAVLRLDQPLNTARDGANKLTLPAGLQFSGLDQFNQGLEYPARAVSGIGFIRRMLISKPERNPRPVLLLRFKNVFQRALQGGLDSLPNRLFAGRKPARPCPDGVRGQVG